MSKPPEIDSTVAFADAMYSGIQLVSEYMKSRSEMISAVLPKSDTGYRDAAIKVLWFRARAWMSSLEALNHTRHFQAISTASRALLEITVDLTLLHYDKTNSSGWKFYWWGMSERMKASEQLVDFYQKRGVPVPPVHSESEQFFNDEKAIIDDFRLKLWPNKKNKPEHPKRWTGNSNLSVDVERSNQLHGIEIKKQLGIDLVEHYRTRYRQLNWQIHSGIAGSWNIPEEGFDIISALAMKDCADLATVCAKVVLTDFGFREALADLSDEWAKLEEQRAREFIRKMQPQIP